MKQGGTGHESKQGSMHEHFQKLPQQISWHMWLMTWVNMSCGPTIWSHTLHGQTCLQHHRWLIPKLDRLQHMRFHELNVTHSAYLWELRYVSHSAHLWELIYASDSAHLWELRYMLLLPACCLRKRRYCLEPVQPKRQKGYSSGGVKIKSMRLTLPASVRNMPNSLSNLDHTPQHPQD